MDFLAALLDDFFLLQTEDGLTFARASVPSEDIFISSNKKALFVMSCHVLF